MNQLQKELLKKHVGPFLFCFFTVMFILLMQFLILYVDQLVGKGLTFRIVLELILNNLAWMVVLAVPMAVLVSTLIAFGRFSEWNELTAVKAAGVNPFSLMKPVLISAAILFGGLVYFANEILPEANHKARTLFIDIRMQKPAFDLQPGVFYDGIDGFTFLAQQIPAGSDTLYDVTVLQESSRERHQAFIKAERGWLVSPDEYTLSLFLQDGVIVRYIPGTRMGDETVERSDFTQHRMSFDLSDLAFSRSNPEQRSRTERTMSSQAMLALIDTLRTEQEKEFSKYMDNIGSLGRERAGPTRSHLIPAESDTLADFEPLYVSSHIALKEVKDLDIQSRVLSSALSSLSRYTSEVDNLRSNLDWRERRIAEYMVEVHKKFSIPFACIIFVLVGAPIGMLTRKGNIGFAALLSAIILTIFFVAIIQGEKWADRLYISPFIGMWGINFLLGALGVLLTMKVSTSFNFRNLLGKE